ncbi:MAG: hypothetical protein QG656_1968, partial [Candidatus Hydrogenedentes bacterium]|nr:hypothetical protein [Candidatus Hydrogenedentota bacterium]
EQDDAPALKRLYDPARPRPALLDRKRESIAPTLDEVRELLNLKEAKFGAFYAIEDRRGEVCGFCVLRGAHPEVRYAEFVVMLFGDDDYATPLADDVFAHLLRQAFTQLQLNKVIAQVLDWETAYRQALVRHGFVSDGVQRDVVFAQGRWFHLETLSLFNPAGHGGS